MMAASGLPLTQGYTINIVKDRAQPAVILLNRGQSGGQRTYFVTLPTEKEEVVEEEVFLLGEGEVAEETVGWSQEEEEVCVEEAVCDGEGGAEPLVCFTEVAHEEVVIEHSEAHHKPRPRPPPRPPAVISVQCDLCGNTLDSPDAAKRHMRTVHNVLTYEGPFFKCDFCGLNVTDRVAHMKVAHYSPLAQVFRKINGIYECLQCNHTSDQLTNIRNHVDAKHAVGENSYVCEECNSEYKTLNSMRAHKSRVHGRKRKLEEGRRKEEDAAQRAKVVKEDRRGRRLEEEIRELEQQTLLGLGGGGS